MPKSSTFLFIVIIIFLITIFASYKLLLININDNHQKNQQIAFYEIQKGTSYFLTKLLYKFSNQKEELIKKHKEVLAYLKNKSSDINLIEIYEKINQDVANKPYNIYITDENLVIKNSTYLTDVNFDLSFAKEYFEEHKQNNIIGASLPIFEIYSSKFFSYTDSYLDDKRVLQVSFTYEELEKDLKNLQDLISQNPNIKSSDAFIFSKDYVGDFMFKSLKSYKKDLVAIQKRISDGKKLA
ncbi:hypothetical protein [Aliarcobacter vitoriensis]|uniref:Double Cache domain-containing protein n=1 Tax=Aliarcobacter vitoriensis TaxID=2011099 RepID=A0A366MUJ0_9BACT|nr:hypothetical protein [Aliarcobacter vitoriensis]RBQ29062.1 hypothetical protein CRU91_05625 [Aliarcobacter vitoriensis]